MTKFLADAMLGSVARKLRIFGFDTLYVPNTSDNEVLRLAAEQDRIILTADKELFKRIIKRGAQGVLVEGTGDLDDMAHIFAKLGISTDFTSRIGSRCTSCNGTLAPRRPEEAGRLVPANVLALHDGFWQCADCKKVYWEGGHLGRIRAFAKSLEDRIAAEASKG
ncbi:MAG TPA: Mut7-C RNAse domain-containing protein [Nitrososphaera sp.]|nr:Mut7-C RNAse domain-containing protein [Nitrososphaera sp.]